MISIVQAPAYLAVQDLGWPSSRSAGMPLSGAMDRWALTAANLMVGNAPDAAALEWALTGGRLRFGRDTQVAVCGPGVSTTLAFPAGGEFDLVRPTEGRFLYLAVSGGLDVPEVLGSRSTYMPAGIGHRLKAGDTVPMGAPSKGRPRMPAGAPNYESGVVRVVAGPQRELFTSPAWERFLESTWRVSRASDRMGYRLEGDVPVAAPAADLPSEAACVGAVQVPPDGLPIVLMADGPTVGGYPKIAVVISADLPVMAQRAVGGSLRFREVSIEESQAMLRDTVPLRSARGTWSSLG
ncbi:MAG TPA: biotin-dependent carboxyltransferase family protein [Gemmatimonadales bacterium]|nr:biotin-dependent carboxyltransferase family protein [Gemmatimonadales bacterium]